MPKHNEVGPKHTVVVKKSGGIQKAPHAAHHTLPGSHSRTFIPAAQRHRAATHTQEFRPVAVHPVSHTQTFIHAAAMPRPVMPAAPSTVVHTQTFIPAAAMPRPVVHTQTFVPAGSSTSVTATQAALHAVPTATRPRM